MGGTTAKACLIEDNEPRLTDEMEVGAGINAGQRLLGGGGYLVRSPTIDLAEIGAGGGSIAWIDQGGALRVGPQSAGAAPGPACYQRGGTLPTVTDANVVLGFLNPSICWMATCRSALRRRKKPSALISPNPWALRCRKRPGAFMRWPTPP
jgi:N-methylhydantoinase A